jgi:tellurite resistance protein
MATTVENPALTAELQRLASQQVQTLRNTAGLVLNYSAEMVQTLDELLSGAQDGVADNDILGYGAYMGETIRRSLGGVWMQDERGVALLVDIGSPGISASPFSWVQKRANNGGGDSLVSRYSALRGQVSNARGAAPPTAGLRISGAPAATPVGAEDDARTLARSPLLVFLLVAAADGKLDKKEFKKFGEVLHQAANCPSPRLRQAIKDMVPHMATIFEDLTRESFNPIEELQRVAQIMDTQYPAEAQVFKESLLSLAVQVAQASGGFLGFGNKIDKNEEEAIAAVAITLGLAGQ